MDNSDPIVLEDQDVPLLGDTVPLLSDYGQYQDSDGIEESQVTLLGQESPLPKDTVNNIESRSRRSIVFRIRPTGWKIGPWIAFLQAAGVLLINLMILVYTGVKTGRPRGGTVYEGTCDTVGHLTAFMHLVINILNALLSGASGYMMHSLCAPTRKEVDKAHERNSWLDIGSQSMRNFKNTSRWKKIMWILLSASSIPIHLLSNSVFFSDVRANAYTPWMAEGPDIQDISRSNGTLNWDCSSFMTYMGACPEPYAQWEVLTAADCMQAYAVEYLSNRGGLVAVKNTSGVDTLTIDGGMMFAGTVTTVKLAGIRSKNQPLGSPYAWICSDMGYGPGTEDIDCDEDWRKIDRANWTLAHFPLDESRQISYCLSETPPSRCQLRSFLPLLITVIFFNAVMVGCIAIAASRMKNDHPLVTVGDAIASFVKQPDSQTEHTIHLVSHQDRSQQLVTWPLPIQTDQKKVRWMSTTSQQHWMITGCLFFGAILIVLILLGYAMHQLNHVYGISGISALWKLGFGIPSNETIIQAIGWDIPTPGYRGLVASVLVANSPQLILSMIFLVFNTLCTKLCLALEWSSYIHSRKSLHGSSPYDDPKQSTYFLQMPYHFGLLRMAYTALLRWFVSQSIFVVVITYWYGNNSYGQLFSCGFSPVGMILTSVVGTSLILGALALGYFKHLYSDVPFASSCSAVIAAACVPPEREVRRV